MPEGLLQALGPPELRGVLAHELEHLRRRDTWSMAVQRAARLLLFLNPFAAWISSWIHEEREAACDQSGAVLGTRSRTRYAEMLLVLHGFRSLPGPSRPELPLLAERGLADRIRRLLVSPPRPGGHPVRVGIVITVLAATLGAGLLVRASLTASALGSWAIMAEDLDRRALPRD
jgi:beta-lactamase regulating signal transducer with metallopeptidase domain